MAKQSHLQIHGSCCGACDLHQQVEFAQLSWDMNESSRTATNLEVRLFYLAMIDNLCYVYKYYQSYRLLIFVFIYISYITLFVETSNNYRLKDLKKTSVN